VIDVAQATNEELLAAKKDEGLSGPQYHVVEAEIQRRLEEHRKAEAARIAALPFNAKTDVSADARHIVKHLWIIFVLLPFALAVLFMILK
jgi:hypothetical protein